MPGPLDGIRILDLSVALTGPLAVGILVDQGASAVKVEQAPFGDPARYVGTNHGGISAMFQVANRGKRSIVLDLRSERGRAILLELAADVDVFVQNFRPGAADRMGIGEDTIRAVSPEVVYLSLSGFGTDGPYAHRRVYDTVIQAQSGLADNQRGLGDEAPVFLRQLAADKITAHTAAQAVTAALFARAMGQGGQHVHLSMLDACVAFLFVDGAGHQIVLDGDHRGPTSAVANQTPLALADGFAAIAPTADAEFHGLARAFGVPSDDPRVATIAARMANPDATNEVLRAVRAAAAAVTLADATARMEAEDVPYGRVVPVADVPTDPQVVANDLFVEHDHPVMGRIRQPRPAARFARTPATLRSPSCPTLGQHSDELVAALGHDPAELRRAGVIA